MTFGRRTRCFTVLFALWAMLGAQFALAGYACEAASQAAAVAEMVEAGLPCAQHMAQASDEEQPGLCHGHCQTDGQSAATFELPVLANSLQLGAVLLVAMAPAETRARHAALESPPPERWPPLAIRHCCWRI